MLIDVLSRKHGIFFHPPSGSGENVLVCLMARSLFVFPCQDLVVIMMNLGRCISSSCVAIFNFKSRPVIHSDDSDEDTESRL